MCNTGASDLRNYKLKELTAGSEVVLMLSLLVRGTECAIILTFDYWAPAWQGGECGCFPFALFVDEGRECFLVLTLGAASVASIYDFTLGFFTTQLLLATYLLCCYFSCESIVVTEVVGTALQTPPASFWGTGLLCLGHMGI